MRILVSLRDGGLAAYATRLQAAGETGRVELARGLNQAGDQIRTIVRQRLKTQMGVLRYGVVESHTRSVPATPALLEYTIFGSGKGLPIKEFPVAAAIGAPVTAEPWAVSHTFARSFMTAKKGLLRARRGKERKPIRALYGPSPAKELIKAETAEAFERAVPMLVVPIIMTRLAKLAP